MLWLYLAALIIGGGIIALQVVLSLDHDADVGHDLHHDGAEGASIFLSARFWTFALLAFGLVGFLLSVFRLSGTALTLALSGGSGVASGLFAALTIRALRRSATTSATLGEAVGKTGKVILPCAKGKVGKVRVSVKGQMVDLLATTDEMELPLGSSVLVAELRGDIAHVMHAPKELGE